MGSGVLAHSTPGVDLAILSLHMAGTGSLLGSINFLCTTTSNRCPAQKHPLKMPLFCWCLAVASFLLLVSLPVLAAFGMISESFRFYTMKQQVFGQIGMVVAIVS